MTSPSPKPVSQAKVQLNVLLEPDLAERLKERCKEEGKSISAFVSQAVEHQLGSNDGQWRADIERRLAALEERF
jgi:predicted HicB family RNase H-like nuclease